MRLLLVLFARRLRRACAHERSDDGHMVQSADANSSVAAGLTDGSPPAAETDLTGGQDAFPRALLQCGQRLLGGSGQGVQGRNSVPGGLPEPRPVRDPGR